MIIESPCHQWLSNFLSSFHNFHPSFPPNCYELSLLNFITASIAKGSFKATWKFCYLFIFCFFIHLSVTITKVSVSQWTRDVKWTYLRRSEDVQYVFLTSYVHSVTIPCPGGYFSFIFLQILWKLKVARVVNLKLVFTG